MAWELDSDRPIYIQLVERIQMEIVSGYYPPGGKLPSVRELAAEAAVNPNTMQKAFAEWFDQGKKAGSAYSMIIFDGEKIVTRRTREEMREQYGY